MLSVRAGPRHTRIRCRTEYFPCSAWIRWNSELEHPVGLFRMFCRPWKPRCNSLSASSSSGEAPLSPDVRCLSSERSIFPDGSN